MFLTYFLKINSLLILFSKAWIQHYPADGHHGACILRKFWLPGERLIMKIYFLRLIGGSSLKKISEGLTKCEQMFLLQETVENLEIFL
jgi:hypothetical protein